MNNILDFVDSARALHNPKFAPPKGMSRWDASRLWERIKADCPYVSAGQGRSCGSDRRWYVSVFYATRGRAFQVEEILFDPRDWPSMRRRIEAIRLKEAA